MYVFLLITSDDHVIFAFDKEEHAIDTVKVSYSAVNTIRNADGSLRLETEVCSLRYIRLCGPTKM